MTTFRRNLLLALLVLLVSAPGCSLFRPAWNADVAVVGIRLENIELFEANTVFTIRVDNEEVEPLILDGSAHEIRIDGRRVGKGLLPDRIEIPRLSSVRIEVPVSISTIGAVRTIRDAIERRSFRYEVDSTLYVLRGGGTRRVHVGRSGNIDLDALRDITP